MRTTTGTSTGTTTGTGTTRLRSRLALAALAGTLGLGLAACSGSGSGPAASTGSARAVAPVAASPSTAPSGSSSVRPTAPAKAPRLADLAARVTAAEKAKGTARMVSTSNGVRSTGLLRFRGKGVDFSATTTIPGGKTVKMVFVGGAAYVNIGQKYQGKSWLRFAPGGSDPLSKALGPLLGQLGTSLDLKTQLAGSQDAKVSGGTRTELAGVPATRYTLVSSEKALLAQLEKLATTPALRNAVRTQYKGAHSEAVLWISDEGLPLRVDSRVLGGATPAAASTVTYSGWGEPVAISAPPRSQVVDLAG